MEPDRGDKVPEPVEDWEERDKDVEAEWEGEEEIRPVQGLEEIVYVLPVGRGFRIRPVWPAIPCPALSAERR